MVKVANSRSDGDDERWWRDHARDDHAGVMTMVERMKMMVMMSADYVDDDNAR